MDTTIRIGEDKFEKLPRVAAAFYNRLMRIEPIQLQYKEIAQDLTSRISGGRLLDVGTGPGRLLLDIHRINRAIDLFGLDISASMIRMAERNLSSVAVDLRRENITETSYDSDYFDLVTCTGSLYLWDNPQEGVGEIYRILKKCRAAYLYEPYRDVDADGFSAAFKANLRKVNPLLRVVGPLLMRKVIETADRVDDYGELISHTSFANSCRIEQVVLGHLPIWLRLELRQIP
jgi:ubiquinone/menaquinone biosynthesis C-methylase UbiE